MSTTTKTIKLDRDGQVICPVCSEQNVHVTDVTKELGGDSYEALDGYVRGDVRVVNFECENGGHTFSFQFGFHKGQTYARTAVP